MQIRPPQNHALIPILLGAVVLAIVHISSNAFATSMTMQQFGPLQFQVPNTWTCQNDADNYICLSPATNEYAASAIVISYKLKSAQDNLDIYQDQLGHPRPIQGSEVQAMSEPKGVKRIQLNNHAWVEGIQLNSEVKDYYTHYYATTTNVNAILASISVPDNSYANQKNLIQEIIQTFNITENTNSPTNVGAIKLPAHMNQQAQTINPKQNKAMGTITIMGKQWPKMYLLLGFALIVTLALLAYAILLE